MTGTHTDMDIRSGIPKGDGSISVVPGGRAELILAGSEIREDSDMGKGQQKFKTLV